ncbi:MAG: MFS transporter [Pseudomonadota bacterium]
MSEPQSGRPLSPQAAWSVVGVLFVAYVFSFLDRQILSLLVEPIQTDLGLSDSQMGLLHGFTFAIFFAIAGVPLAWAIDNGDRRRIIAAGIAFWSIATALCGFASRFWHLFVARIGVAVGEAVLLPGMSSIIGDSFPPERRGIATAVFSLGIAAGGGLALFMGGVAIGALDNVNFAPFGGEPFATWQLVFLVVGLPGLLAALAVFLSPIPTRPKKTSSKDTHGFRETIGFFSEHRKTFTLHFLGIGFASMVGYGNAFWVPTYFSRLHGWEADQIGIVFGLFNVVLGVPGLLLAGYLADKQVAKGHVDGKLRVALTGAAFMSIPGIVMALASNLTIVLVALGLHTFFLFTIMGVAMAAMQDAAPPHLRGQATAVYSGVLNLIGLGMGPLLIGLLTDHVYGAPDRIGFSIATCTAIGGVLSVLCWLRALRPFRETVQSLQTGESAGPAPSPAPTGPMTAPQPALASEDKTAHPIRGQTQEEETPDGKPRP